MTRIDADAALLTDLGARIQRRRHELDLTREEVASHAGIGLSTVQRIEGGQSTQVVSLLRTLRALELPLAVDDLIAAPDLSPLRELERPGRTRRRASRRARPETAEGGWSWGDER